MHTYKDDKRKEKVKKGKREEEVGSFMWEKGHTP